MKQGNITLHGNVDTYILGDNLRSEYVGGATHNLKKKVGQIKGSLERGRKVVVFVPEIEHFVSAWGESLVIEDKFLRESRRSMLKRTLEEINQYSGLTVIATATFDAKKIEDILDYARP